MRNIFFHLATDSKPTSTSQKPQVSCANALQTHTSLEIIICHFLQKDLKLENIERERRPEINFKHVSPKNCSYSRHKFWPFEYISNHLLLAFSTRPHFLNALVVDNFKSILGSYIRYETRILKCNSKRDTRLKNIYLVLY